MQSVTEAFEEMAETFDALEEAAETLKRRLDGHTWALVGATSMWTHGVKRATDDVDILVTLEAQAALHEIGGIRPRFANAQESFFIHGLDVSGKPLKLDVNVVGEPMGAGDSGMSFPAIDESQFERDDRGIWVPKLETLIMLKLVAGKFGKGRNLKDYADVRRLIQHAKLDASYADKLPEIVRDAFLEILANGFEDPET